MKLSRKQKRTLFRILLSGALLVLISVLRICDLLPDAWYILLPLYLIPYLPVGYDVLWDAVQKIAHGQLLDENFLMSIATVGAFAIGEYPEAVFVMLFYQVGELFQSIAVGKSRKSIAALMDIRPDEARVQRNGEEMILSPEEVEIGEILVIRPGEKIPLDGIVLEGHSTLDTRSLTGESLPRTIEAGDEAISGCINLSGLITLRVTKPFGESTVSKILELVENSSLVKSKAENAVTKFAHWYTPLVVAGALLLATVPSLFTGDWARWIQTALIFLVVSCPCALVISVPLSYFGGLGSASRHGILVKGANRLEMLADADTVVFDKTGTLTMGDFSVVGINPVAPVTSEELLCIAAVAEQNSNHPIAESIKRAYALQNNGQEVPSATEIEELAGYGVRAVIDGKSYLVGNARLMKKEEIDCQAADADGTLVYISREKQFLGSLLIADQIKENAADAIAEMRTHGVQKAVMLTGDREQTAQTVCSELHLDAYAAELLPADKVAYLEKLLGETVGALVFVGDGVNDAPAMARADVGIAMGAMGSDAAIEAADVVLMDDDLKKISTAIGLSRFTRRIVRQNIVFAIGIKALFLILSIFNLTNMWAATFADVGVAVIAILNAMRTLRK